MQQKNIELYRNYGVLGAENQDIYTYGISHSMAVVSDTILVKVPDEWELFENIYGETLIMAPWGWKYDINDLLNTTPSGPCFSGIDKFYNPFLVKLDVVNRVDADE